MQNSKPLYLILFIFGALALAYSLILPLGEAADERHHFDLARFIAETGRPPLSVAEREAIGPKGDAAPFYHGLLAILFQRVNVSAEAELPRVQENPKRLIPFDGIPVDWILHTDDEAFPFRGIALAWHLARLLSIPLGAATIIGVYLTTLAIYPQRRYLALAAAAFVAFLPRFIISSAIVSDDNLVIPLITFAVYILVRVAQGDQRRRTLFVLGLLMGLAAISKYHSLVLLPEAFLILALLARRNRATRRTLLRYGGWVILPFALVAGWWFGFLFLHFNQVAELGLARGLMAPLGDPVVTSGVENAFNFQPGQSGGGSFGWFDWAALTFKTFWVSYGSLKVLASTAVYWAVGLLTLVSLAGLLVKFRAWQTSGRGKTLRLDIVALGMHTLIYLAVITARFLSQHLPETAQGRHLYPAISAIAFFFVFGLSVDVLWLARRFKPSFSSETLRFHLGRMARKRAWRDTPHTPRAIGGSFDSGDRITAASVGVFFLSLALITPFRFILPVYNPLPIERIDASQARIMHRFDTAFAKGMRFVGYNLSTPTVRGGAALPLTLYWQVEAELEQDYLIQTCLRDPSGNVVSCYRGHPVDGRYPTRAWETGYLVKEQILLPLPYCLPAGEYEITLSALPLRVDTPLTTIEPQASLPPPLTLGTASVEAAPSNQLASRGLWVNRQFYTEGDIVVTQLRRPLMAVGDFESLRFEPLDAADGQRWQPIAPDVAYTCPDGTTISTASFAVDPGVAPGAYRLLHNGGDAFELTIHVQTRPRQFAPPVDIGESLDADFGGQLELLGYKADISPRLPGDALIFDLYWRARQTMGRPYIGSFHLLDRTMTSWGQADQILGGAYQNLLWAPGEVAPETYRLSLDLQTPPGLYTLEYSVYDHTEGDFRFLPVSSPDNPQLEDHLYLGQLRVLDPAHNNPPQQALTATLGEQIQLLGADMPPVTLLPDAPLEFALYWQAIVSPQSDYTVFTQLIGPDGQVWAQQDNYPQSGRYPTTAWQVDDRVVDRYALHLSDGAPPGDYRLLVGMYDLNTGQRLPVIDAAGNRLPDDAILLAVLELVE